uniref:Uncharacterized protein n=1 Tax=Peronospora matthiolae TaxID=2874970 RepID=A0AAV1VAH7_9STRA
MARSKEQWNAQQRALHTQNKSKSAFYQGDVKESGLTPSGSRVLGPFVSPKLLHMDRFNSGAPSPASPATAVTNLRTFEFGHAPRLEHLNDCQSNQVIDLTMDDEDSEKDETVEQPIGSGRVAPAADGAPAYALSSRASDSTNNETAVVKMQLKHHGEMTSEIKMPMTEDIESDVDEEWPLVPGAPVSSMTSKESLLIDHQAAYSRTEEDVGATLDAICKTVSLFQGESGDGNSEQNDQADTRWQHKSTLNLCDDKGSSTTDTDVGEGISHHALEENEDAARVVTLPDPINECENLEDGEIFEEGGPPVSVLPIKIVEPTPSVHVSTASVDAMGTNSHPRHKKQKKRGKKKAKRKLETMQTLHASPCEIGTVFKRTVRQRPYVSASPSDQHRHGTVRNGTRGEAMDVRPVFQDPPPAFFHASGPHAGGPRAGILHPPTGPSQQHRLAPPPVLQYGDSQILRVNRQGSAQMLEGGAGPPVRATFSEPLMQVGAALPLPRTYLEPPMQVGAPLSLYPTFSDRPVQGGAGMSFPRTFSEPLVQGGFRYRSMPASSSLPVSNRQGFSLKHFQSTSSRPPPVSAPCHDVAVSKKRDESDDFNLDSLRVAALRSKTKHVVKTTESTGQKVTVAQSSPPPLRSPSILGENEKGRENQESPEVDELRLEILQSMKRKRHCTVNDAKPKEVSSVSEPVAMETSDENGLSEVATTNPLASCMDQDTTNTLSEPKALDVTTDTDHIEAERPTSEMNKPAVGDEQKQVDDSTAFCITASLEPAQSRAGLTVSPPEFRPLTASSQSLVIQLSPDDFSPQTQGGDADTKALASSSLQNAIQEMRRKIAEREKEKTNRLSLSAATRLSQQSFDTLSSLALSSTSSQDKQVLAEFAQLADATALSTDASASAERTGFLPAEVIVDGLENNISGQTEASVMKETVLSPAEANLSAETTETATGQDSQPKPVLAPEALSDTLGGVATLTIADDVERRVTCRSIATDKSEPHSATVTDSELDFDAVQAEYEQCVNEYKEAEMHIARLSHEMAQLEKRLPQFRSIVEEESGR